MIDSISDMICSENKLVQEYNKIDSEISECLTATLSNESSERYKLIHKVTPEEKMNELSEKQYEILKRIEHVRNRIFYMLQNR